MRKTRMATHSDSAFNEAKEVRMLSEVLEKDRMIKTFFGENEKTPNHDGFFEILSKSKEPKKQFIVQIKKVENLEKEKAGKNKDCYVYSLNTSFLYYVKEKVTESPAIYFVVDIAANRIFYLYLSDAVLMNLDFEGQDSVSYKFTDNDILINSSDFYEKLFFIAQERNEKFLGKTPTEIAEIQEAVEYLNNLLNNDLHFIKKKLFPNLWRFGIAHSMTPVQLTFPEKANGVKQIVSVSETSAFAVYPQIKGTLDYGIKEYNYSNDNFCNVLDMTGKTKPAEYIKKVVEDILKNYFENTDFDIMPNEVSEEFVWEFNKRYLSIHGMEISAIENIECIYKRYLITMRYLEYLLTSTELTAQEMALRNMYSQKTSSVNISVRSRLDILKMVQGHFKKDFIDFCNKETETGRGFLMELFSVVDKTYIRYFMALKKLQDNNVNQIMLQSNHNWYECSRLDDDALLNKANQICDTWFENTVKLYRELYVSLFNNEKYFYCNEFKYMLAVSEFAGCKNLLLIYRKYESPKLKISRSSADITQFKDFQFNDGQISISSGVFADRIFSNKLYADSLRMLLYQGICEALEIECHGIIFNRRRETFFY